MERKNLVDEIADFCFDYWLSNKPDKIEKIKERIENKLEDSDFVESLINTVILKTKHNKNVDVEKSKILLLELEKIRLELEYGEKSHD